MKTFFITGLPRSRTAWLANLLTQEDSFCFHEVLSRVDTMEELDAKMRNCGKEIVGICDPTLMLKWREVRERFPDAPWVLIERNPQESLESFRKIIPQYNEDSHNRFLTCMKQMSDSMNGQCLHIAYDYLNDFSTCEAIVKRCTGQRLSEERFQLLEPLNVQQIPDKATKYMREPVRTQTEKAISGFIDIRPISTQEEMQAVLEAARKDNHNLLYPTHYVLLHGEIVGSLSICAIPAVAFWASSTKISGRQAIEMVNIGKTIGRLAAGKPVLTWCAKNSPFYSHMSRLGFIERGDTTTFIQEAS